MGAGVGEQGLDGRLGCEDGLVVGEPGPAVEVQDVAAAPQVVRHPRRGRRGVRTRLTTRWIAGMPRSRASRAAAERDADPAVGRVGDDEGVAEPAGERAAEVLHAGLRVEDDRLAGAERDRPDRLGEERVLRAEAAAAGAR